MSRCDNCKYFYSVLSDICDGCRYEPNVGFFGYTDGATGRHYKNEQEERDYLRFHNYDYYEPWNYEVDHF